MDNNSDLIVVFIIGHPMDEGVQNRSKVSYESTELVIEIKTCTEYVTKVRVHCSLPNIKNRILVYRRNNTMVGCREKFPQRKMRVQNRLANRCSCIE